MSYLAERWLPYGRLPAVGRTNEVDVRTQRQDARRRAREARTVQDEARKAREKRLEDLAVKVLVAVDAITDQERRAGEALWVMVEEEGLSLREAVGWCGDEVSVRIAARFKRLVSERSEDGDAETGDVTGASDKANDEPADSPASERAGAAFAAAAAAGSSTRRGTRSTG